MRLSDLPTPALILDRGKLEANLNRMNKRLAGSTANLRPHVKTAKSVDVARLAVGGWNGAITVSTLLEAEHFFQHGFGDILYGVGIAPAKLPRVASLTRQGATIHLLLDSVAVAQSVIEFAQRENVEFSVLIEVDCDGHRSGVVPDSPTLLGIGNLLYNAECTRLGGVMTHAGESYSCKSTECIAARAETERQALLLASERLRSSELPCPIVSAGSSPTAFFAKDRSGLTEVRAGVYMFQDLFQMNLGTCQLEHIAVSVLGTVIGHQQERNWLITDAGALALSKDRGTASQHADYGYGLVCDMETGLPLENYLVVNVNQEHGIVSTREGGVDFSHFPRGSRLRILPNHACMTAARYDRYQVLNQTGQIETHWPRINGW